LNVPYWSVNLISRLIKLVKSFGQQRVLLVGDLILDRYVYGDAERISPEAPVPVLRQQHTDQRVGGTGSVAANLHSLGIQAICCGAVGNDRAGTRVRKMLEEQKISTDGVISIADRPTTTKTRFVGLAQHRHRQQLMRVDDEVTLPIADADAKRLMDLALAAISEVDVVCLEDYDKGLLSEKLCQRVIKAALAADIPVLVDPARLNDYSKYRGSTLLTPNRSEYGIVAGIEDTSLEAIETNASELVDRYALGGLLVTLDRDGSLLVRSGATPVRVPTRPRAVYDNTGAGDAVLAMLAAAVAAGADWEDAAALANVAGGLEVEKFGAVPVTCDEVIADLHLSDGTAVTKIRPLDQLLTELKLRRSRGETIVFTNGCYDLLHAGHVRFFEHCRAVGDVVIAGMNSDASVRAQNKGSNRPIIPQEQRAEVLAGLQNVDYVVIFDDPTPLKLIEAITPDVLVKGEDWKDKGVVGREHVEANGGRVDLVPLLEGISTTHIVERIASGSLQEAAE
jgi:D-beta-D-heptose 7-phosphate kinase/D-beta-D-heptose 1-phosphate adenosyltransferase